MQEMHVNRVKQAIAHSHRIRGVHLTFAATQIIDTLSALALDFVYLDGEHGRFDLRDIQAHAIAAKRAGMTPIARVPENSVAAITQFLDRGVQGIVVPHVENAADAKRAVAATYFGPLGERSYGSNFPKHARGNATMPQLLAAANRETSLCVMLESAASLEAIAEIAATPGVSYFSIGAVDLAQALGFPGEPGAPAVVEAIAKAVARIRGAGKIVREDFMQFCWIGELLLAGGRAVLGDVDRQASLNQG
jgi:2-keto-3-deoxy-L-rhamnonate aldolase RhmA